jgi:flagellar basal-body rod modification protein FlgD
MITQLQQQDPLNPSDSNQLLTQMSQISTLQSNTVMADNLKSLTLQQSIGAAGNLIGKSIQGLDEQGDTVTGMVTSVRVENRKVFLELDSSHTLPMENLTNVSQTGANADAALLAALPELKANIQNIASNSGSMKQLLALLGGVTGS